VKRRIAEKWEKEAKVRGRKQAPDCPSLNLVFCHQKKTLRRNKKRGGA